jgi:hypothetical protein
MPTKKTTKKASVKKPAKKVSTKKAVAKKTKKTQTAVVVVTPVVSSSGVVTMTPVSDDIIN